MPDQIPLLFGFNLIEMSGVTFTVTGEVAAKPKERLFDRRAGLEYEDTSNAGSREFKSNQGSGIQAVGVLLVGPGHNLNGATVALESSPDNTVWTPRGSLVVSGSGMFKIDSGTTWTVQYTRTLVTGAAAAPKITEMFFGRKVTLVRRPSEPGVRQGLLSNTRRLVGTNGHVWKGIRGDPRATIEYLIRDITQTERTSIETVYKETSGGGKFLFLEDADGVLRWVEWLNLEMIFEAVPIYRHDMSLRFEEVVN